MSPLILAVISGVGFTFIGIAYRLGQDHGVPPIRIAILTPRLLQHGGPGVKTQPLKKE